MTRNAWSAWDRMYEAAYQRGWDAYEACKGETNPFDKDKQPREHAAWEKGNQDAFDMDSRF